jgi:hypothetical protein
MLPVVTIRFRESEDTFGGISDRGEKEDTSIELNFFRLGGAFVFFFSEDKILAISSTVGLSNNMARENFFTLKRFLIAPLRREASKECPPMAKKSSRRPTGSLLSSRPNTSAIKDATIFSFSL